MKSRKIVSLLIAVAMMAQVLPLSLFANESEEVAESYIVSELTYVDSSSLVDNDELLEGYIEELFGVGSNSGIMLTATYTGEDALSGMELKMYNQLKTAIESIAAGERTSTVISLSGIYYTYSELGITFMEEIGSAIGERVESVVHFLLSDCPYEMYWFDKENGYSISYSSNCEVISIKFCVASDYQANGSNTTVDSSMIASAKVAAEYAQTIASQYASYSDEEKLTAFKEIICSLVSYYSGSTSIDYGDVWQLVYVFDQDTSTNVVCEGYSKAFQYLCDLCGLDCITVSGVMSSGTGAGDHMWNVVYLDGVNYLVDVTNSDSGSVGQNGGLFMVCADDATESSSTGYAFTVNGRTITYAYGSDTLNMYPESYLTLGTVALEETYSITVSATENGAVVSDVITAGEGDTVTLTVTPDDGYVLSSVSVTDSSGNAVTVEEQINGTYTFEMPASDVTVTAVFEEEVTKYTINIDNDVHCSGNAVSSAAEGEEVTLTVTLDEGYGYARIYIQTITSYDSEGVAVTFGLLDDVILNSSTGWSYTFIMPAYDLNIFLFDGQYTISTSTNDSEAGTVNDGWKIAEEGESITFTAFAYDGYTLSEISVVDANNSGVAVTLEETYSYDDSVTVGTVYAYTFTMPASDVTIVAVFEAIHTHTLIETSATDATCTSDGNIDYWYCAGCDKYFSDENSENEITLEDTVIDALGHSYGDPTFTWSGDYSTVTATFTCTEGDDTQTLDCTVTSEITTEATCIATGVKTYTASVTFDSTDYTDTKTETLDMVDHNYEAVVTDPTCTEKGCTTYTCSVCGDSYTADETEATGHSYEAVVTNPTCTEKGYTTYTCSACGDSYTADETEATGHSYEAVVTNPTCTEKGYTTYTCSACGDSYTADETEATGHSYEAVVTDPTCTEKGYTTYTCSLCGDSYTTDETEATGHSYEAVVTDPTCTEKGYTTYTCSACGDSYTADETEATGHDYEAVVTDPTCTEKGYTTYTCSVCGDTYAEDIDALGHSYTFEVITEPTCTETGVRIYTCSVCGDTYTEDIDALGHSYTSEVITEPTCTETGVRTYTCSVCGDTYTEDIDALGHTYTSEVTVEPTCTETGVRTYICTVCGETYTEEVSATGHTAGTAVRENVVAATNTTNGSYDLVTYCTVCGAELSRETITVPATGVDMITIWLATPANYTAVNSAIAKANALNPDDYTNFSEVTAAIDAIDWNLSVLSQSIISGYVESIETAIANLIPVGTTAEDISIYEPIESTDTETEDEGEDSGTMLGWVETSDTETNPTTGIVLTLVPMAMAALVAVSSKRR